MEELQFTIVSLIVDNVLGFSFVLDFVAHPFSSGSEDDATEFRSETQEPVLVVKEHLNRVDIWVEREHLIGRGYVLEIALVVFEAVEMIRRPVLSYRGHQIDR